MREFIDNPSSIGRFVELFLMITLVTTSGRKEAASWCLSFMEGGTGRADAEHLAA